VADRTQTKDAFYKLCTPRRLSRSLRRVVLVASVSFGLLALNAAPALAAVEAPETLPVTEVTGTTAVAHGVLNPHSESGPFLYDFFYAIAPAGCAEGEAAFPEPEVESVATGQEGQAVEKTVTNLHPSTEYALCAASLISGEPAWTFGNHVSFTTPSLPPAIDSQGASGVAPFGARLEGLVNANNQATTCKFEYGETTAYGSEASCALESPEAFGDQAVAATLTGLEPTTTYHFRIVAENAAKETTEHADGEFTTLTPEKPIVGAESVSGLTAAGATLNALVNPNYQEATFAFEYATDEALTSATTVDGPGPLPAVFAEEAASVETGALVPRTTYYYRALAANATGTSEGAVEHFTTLGTPILTTTPAQSITRTTAALSGTVDPGGAATTFHFDYITAASYEEAAPNPYANGQTTPEGNVAATDYAPHPTGAVPALELPPGTTYHYALVATNAAGTTTSADATFTTASPTPPLVQTGGASAISQNGAIIAAVVNGQGLQTSYAFEVGTSAGSYGPAIEVGNVPSGAGEQSVTLALNGLAPGTTYHYRVTATNLDGTRQGEDRTFTTGSTGTLTTAPLQFLSVPSISLPSGSQSDTGTHGTKPLTNKQKLKKALKACRTRHNKQKRAACERQAHKRYATAKRRGRR
jgi:phosphodiesterase/alkaline phosphatase D-like protein